jgi:hypothetical protein
MSSAETAAPTLKLHHFIVYAPDKTEPGTFEKRMSILAKHLETAKTHIESGLISKSMEHLDFLYVMLQIQVNS